MEQNRRVEGGEDIHDAVMMGKVCHMVVDDVGSGKVFLGKNKRGKI